MTQRNSVDAKIGSEADRYLSHCGAGLGHVLASSSEETPNMRHSLDGYATEGYHI